MGRAGQLHRSDGKWVLTEDRRFRRRAALLASLAVGAALLGCGWPRSKTSSRDYPVKKMPKSAMLKIVSTLGLVLILQKYSSRKFKLTFILKLKGKQIGTSWQNSGSSFCCEFRVLEREKSSVEPLVRAEKHSRILTFSACAKSELTLRKKGHSGARTCALCLFDLVRVRSLEAGCLSFAR